MPVRQEVSGNDYGVIAVVGAPDCSGADVDCPVGSVVGRASSVVVGSAVGEIVGVCGGLGSNDGLADGWAGGSVVCGGVVVALEGVPCGATFVHTGVSGFAVSGGRVVGSQLGRTEALGVPG